MLHHACQNQRRVLAPQELPYTVVNGAKVSGDSCQTFPIAVTMEGRSVRSTHVAVDAQVRSSCVVADDIADVLRQPLYLERHQPLRTSLEECDRILREREQEEMLVGLEMPNEWSSVERISDNDNLW